MAKIFQGFVKPTLSCFSHVRSVEPSLTIIEVQNFPVASCLCAQIRDNLDDPACMRGLGENPAFDADDVGFELDPLRDTTTDRLTKIQHLVDSGVDASAARALTSTQGTKIDPDPEVPVEDKKASEE